MNMKAILKLAIAPLGFAALSGCVSAEPTMLPDGSDVRLGETAYVNGPKVKAVKILEDSRCPMNARCIWAGRVKLKMLWLRPSGNKPFEVILGEPVQLADGTFSLTSVRPERMTNQELKPRDYRFSFEFAGGL